MVRMLLLMCKPMKCVPGDGGIAGVQHQPAPLCERPTGRHGDDASDLPDRFPSA